MMTPSCTAALELAALALDLRAGDEVIVPSFTFVSTASAFALRGVKLRFADIRPDTLNIDPNHVRALANDATRVIAPVHYAGVACDMDILGEIARGVDAVIVEDNAHGLFGDFRGTPLGSLGAMATQSFHDTKNFTCGEGGALIINDASLIERAEILREKGTNRSRFFRGEIDKYTWVEVGSSYLLSDILASVLLSQLQERERVQGQRETIWNRYAAELWAWAGDNDVRLPIVPPHSKQAFHMFYLLLPGLEERSAFIGHLGKAGVQAVFHYLPLHLSTVGRAIGGTEGQLPVTESVSDRLVRLPFFTDMTADEQAIALDAILEFKV